MSHINLSHFADGAVQEKFDREFQRIVENIQDPNTDWKKARSLTVQLTFKTDEDRELLFVNIITKANLAQSKDATAKILIGMDGQGGYLANELNTQIPGQQRLRVDLETGELMDEAPTNFEGIKLIK